jgi:hypothetical protein
MAFTAGLSIYLENSQLISDAKATALAYHFFDNEIAASAWLQQH